VAKQVVLEDTCGSAHNADTITSCILQTRQGYSSGSADPNALSNYVEVGLLCRRRFERLCAIMQVVSGCTRYSLDTFTTLILTNHGQDCLLSRLVQARRLSIHFLNSLSFAAARSTPRSDLHEPSRDYFIKPWMCFVPLECILHAFYL